jgi:hypothetical protein
MGLSSSGPHSSKPRCAADSGGRAPGCVFFTVEGRIGGSLPSADALRAEPFATQQATNPFVGDRRQQLALPTVLGQFGNRPNREGQAALGRVGQGHIDQFPELFGAEDRGTPLGVGYLLEAGKATLIEPMDPVIGDGEMAADTLGRLLQPEPTAHLIDDAVALMHANRQRQIPELGPQHALFGARKRSQRNSTSHPGSLRAPGYHVLGYISWNNTSGL